MRKNLFWSTLSKDVQMCARSCIHYLSTTGGGHVPRSFGLVVHVTNPNDVLQFDYIEIAEGSAFEKYILMLRDDHSEYRWLYSFSSTSAKISASAIIEWQLDLGFLVDYCRMGRHILKTRQSVGTQKT